MVSTFYQSVEGQLASLASVEIYGSVESYNLYKIVIGDISKPAVLITAGVHGNEPAGVQAAIKFANEHAKNHPDFCFYIYPCLNPSGYDHGTRWTADESLDKDQKDINRAMFEGSTLKEAVLFMASLEQGPKNYVLTFDLHETLPEDWEVMLEQTGESDGFKDPTEFYMYEWCVENTQSFAPMILNQVGKIGDMCKWEEIYGEKNNAGVISYPGSCQNPDYAEVTVIAYLTKKFTKHAITTETSTSFPMQQNVKMHIETINTALYVLGGACGF